MTDRPLVSALVPAYRAAGFIDRTLDSLAAQTWPEMEIVIADDCSPDDTLAIVTAFAEARGDTRVIARRENLGWLRNTNALMGEARGALMFFAFHDDLVEPTYVEALAGALVTDRRAILAFSDMDVTNVEGTTEAYAFDELDGVTSRVARGLVMARKPRGWWVPNRGLFRAEAFGRIGGIKPNAAGEYSADWTWLLHMALLGAFRRVPQTLCHKFYTRGSISRSWANDAGQKEALRAAGLDEIRESRLPPHEKAVLLTYLRHRERLPRLVRRVLRRTYGVRV
jgi:glycosyltransferase involved in cell wall biosynthesis